MATRTAGGMRFRSKAYLTKNTTPKNRASPPIQAKSLAPMNCSMLKTGAGAATGFGAGPCGGRGGGTGGTAGATAIGVCSLIGMEGGNSISGSTRGARGALGSSSSR